MWYKVQELKKKGFNNSQISRETELDRTTVRKYLLISEDEFHTFINSSKTINLKLSDYIPSVKNWLAGFPDLSAAQIEDRLKEHFEDLPSFHSKTVYNLVQVVRNKYDIPKPKVKDNRIFEMLPQTPYGEQAQVDFGETWLQTVLGKRQKIYFFVMVLSRSRYKFIHFEGKPYTASSASLAHEFSFEYFEGIPREIIYDQDSVFIHSENLGDYILTKDFNAFCKTHDFKTVFCRKADPQSKGKVENVVKYVKLNFLRGRKYTNIDNLNTQGIAWLKRTGNSKKHSSTQKIPYDEWCKEKKYLSPIRLINSVSSKKYLSYKVRKDNTILYKSNFYSLPAGTYKDDKTNVLIEVKTGKLKIYTSDNKFVTLHNISINKGNYVRNNDHKREKSKTLPEVEKLTFEMLGKSEAAKLFLSLLKKDKPRYYRDNLQFIKQKYIKANDNIVDASLLFCIENKQFNSSVLLQVMENKNSAGKKEKEAEIAINAMSILSETVEKEQTNDIQKSNIEGYEKFFETWTN
ncbi:MAG: IS21 family transposase [Bacteroidales bacterium]|nr:IS21 family transposase [Bacteroidales bacterium]